MQILNEGALAPNHEKSFLDGTSQSLHHVVLELLGIAFRKIAMLGFSLTPLREARGGGVSNRA